MLQAHPDDEILGCGGTVARLVQEGYEAFTLILGEGITSRDFKRDVFLRKEELMVLQEQAKKSNNLLGIQDIFMKDYPDNRLDTVPFLDIVKEIERVKNRISPQVIFTHNGNDLNIDHQILSKAVITATRPLVLESVREVYSFETISSTEWNFPLSFSPDLFFDISQTLEIKLKAMACYEKELKVFPHPRSLKGIRLRAQNWGIQLGISFAEAFKVVRIIR